MLCIEFHTTQPDIVLALLSSLPFEGFQEFEDRIHGYIPDDEWEKFEIEIRSVLSGKVAQIKAAISPDVNWNAVWESSFAPVVIDDFCAIRASFHAPVRKCMYELIIDPKMAFGTGHHESTELMIRQMRKMDFHGKSVLDLGCGTGILAILASKRGARTVAAIDHDEEAYHSTLENTTINEVKINCLHGEISSLPSGTYNIVLANINRNALIQLMPEISRVLKEQGTVLMSGILPEDKGIIGEAAVQEGFALVGDQCLKEWIALSYTALTSERP